MKAPDKLFLHQNYWGEVGANWLTFPLTRKDECYIRKDALLDWLKAVKADPMIPMNIDRVIEKIESL